MVLKNEHKNLLFKKIIHIFFSLIQNSKAEKSLQDQIFMHMRKSLLRIKYLSTSEKFFRDI